jgi:hypothetical protein
MYCKFIIKNITMTINLNFLVFIIIEHLVINY